MNFYCKKSFPGFLIRCAALLFCSIFCFSLFSAEVSNSWTIPLAVDQDWQFPIGTVPSGIIRFRIEGTSNIDIVGVSDPRFENSIIWTTSGNNPILNYPDINFSVNSFFGCSFYAARRNTSLGGTVVFTYWYDDGNGDPGSGGGGDPDNPDNPDDPDNPDNPDDPDNPDNPDDPDDPGGEEDSPDIPQPPYDVNVLNFPTDYAIRSLQQSALNFLTNINSIVDSIYSEFSSILSGIRSDVVSSFTSVIDSLSSVDTNVASIKSDSSSIRENVSELTSNLKDLPDDLEKETQKVVTALNTNTDKVLLSLDDLSSTLLDFYNLQLQQVFPAVSRISTLTQNMDTNLANVTLNTQNMQQDLSSIKEILQTMDLPSETKKVTDSIEKQTLDLTGEMKENTEDILNVLDPDLPQTEVKDQMDSISVQSRALDLIAAKLLPSYSFFALGGDNLPSWTISLPLSSFGWKDFDITFGGGDWETVAGGKLIWLMSFLRSISIFVFAFLFLKCIILYLRQW